MSDVGFLQVGWWILTSRMSDVGCRIFKVGCRIFTSRMLDFNMSDVGFRIFASRMSDIGFLY